MKLTTSTQVSVDGVMQANGGRNEKLDPGIERGGWARPLFDDEAMTFVQQVYQRADAFLFGRPEGETMGKVVVVNRVTLDGVMQGPGRPDEDTRDGFEHGGWAVPRSDDVIGAKVAEWLNGEPAFCSAGAATRTCSRPGTGWAARSRTRSTTLRSTWPPRVPRRGLSGQTRRSYTATSPASVSKLKPSSGGNLVIMGSGELIGSLMAAELIDVFLLMIHPLVLGTGRRLFGEGAHASLRLTDSATTTKGVLLASYEPAMG